MQIEKPVIIFAFRATSWLSTTLPSFHRRSARWLMMMATIPVGKKKNIVAMIASDIHVLGGCVVSSLSLRGDSLWKKIGKEPSGTAFNSLIQLEIEKGIPRNPFINAGAIVMADILVSHLKDPKTEFLNFVRALADNDTITYNEKTAISERETGYLNAAIANLLKYHGTIENDIETVLHFYFLMCSVEMSCDELSKAFLAFANHSRPFDYAGITLTTSQVKRMNAIMQTCGFYDEAGEFAYLVGLPGKSGVGGGIVAIYPMLYSVAVWSPRLNSKGNSVMGIKALELFTTETKESIF